MALSGRILLTGAWLIAGVVLLGAANPGPSRNTEQDLQLRLQRETNPAKKARYEIRLGRLKLLEAIDAFDKRDAQKARELLAAYLMHIRSAWQLLQGSGRNAFVISNSGTIYQQDRGTGTTGHETLYNPDSHWVVAE